MEDNENKPMEAGEEPEDKGGDKDDKKGGAKGVIIELVRDFAIALVIALLFTQILKPTIVQEYSMEPNFHNNDYLLVYRLAYKAKEPAKGDVIVFKSKLKTDDGKTKLLIKRVVGRPGDTVQIEDGEVFINGDVDDQSYTNDQYTDGDMTVKVPKGKLFCMGDNRLVSRDSRDPKVGLVDESAVVGKVVFRLLPIKTIGKVENPYKAD
ncbi:MAG: signal peptidase I [Eubacteriales bacterium]|nr:signal peptidase I [Eubacteriales bacterium]